MVLRPTDKVKMVLGMEMEMEMEMDMKQDMYVPRLFLASCLELRP